MSWWVLKRTIHASWVLTLISLGFLTGVFIAQFIDGSLFGINICLVVGSILILVVLLRSYIYLIPIMIIAGVILGLWRGSLSQSERVQYGSYLGQSVTVTGKVKDDIDTSHSNQASMQLTGVVIDGSKLPGQIWVTTGSADIKRGDNLILQGKLVRGFGNFSGAVYGAKIVKIIQSSHDDLALTARDGFANGVHQALPEKEANLGIGLLVGQRRALSQDMLKNLQLVGLTHIIVVSGYNLTIIIRLARKLLEKASKFLATLASGVLVIIFTTIAGASPSMVRAGLVAGLSLAAWYYGRRFHPITLLLLVAAVTVSINPSYLWSDIAWQLSFAAFAGIMILAPLLNRYFFGDRKVGFIGRILIETTSAQIATLPIIISVFGQMSNVALIANVLVMPFIPIAMLLVFIAGIGGLLIPGILATILGLPAKLLIDYIIGLSEILASLPWVSTVINIKPMAVVGAYSLLILVAIYLWRATKYNLRESNIVV